MYYCTSYSQLYTARCSSENAIKMAQVHTFCNWRHPLKYPINTWKSTRNAVPQAQTHTTCIYAFQSGKQRYRNFPTNCCVLRHVVFCLWRPQRAHTQTYTHSHTSSHPVLAGAREQLGWRACLLLLLILQEGWGQPGTIMSGVLSW